MYVNYTYCGNHFAIYGASHVVLVVKNLPASAEDVKKRELDPWVGKISWRKAWQPTYVIMMTVFYVKYLWRKLREKKKRVAILNEEQVVVSQCGFRGMCPWQCTGVSTLVLLCPVVIVHEQMEAQEKVTKGSNCSGIRFWSWVSLLPQAWDPDHKDF